MREDSTVALQSLLNRLAKGDRRAARQLLERAHARLRKLTARILTGSFPALQPIHDLELPVGGRHRQAGPTPGRDRRPIAVGPARLVETCHGKP
jgi:hypothetical protein